MVGWNKGWKVDASSLTNISAKYYLHRAMGAPIGWVSTPFTLC